MEIAPRCIGSREDRQFDFGSVILGGRKPLIHEYLIKNSSSRPVRLLRAVNGKPCCGEIDGFERQTIDPGRSGMLRIKLHPQELGSVSHRAIVETDVKSEPTIEFWTLADCHSRFNVSSIRAGGGVEAAVLRLRPGEEVRREFVLTSLASSEEAPPRLDDSLISAKLSATWSANGERRRLGNGLQEASRHFSVLVKAGEPGQHSEEIAFTRDSNVLTRTLVSWVTLPLITATPAGLILSSDPQAAPKQVIVSSTDRTRFRIKSVRASLPDVEISSSSAAFDHRYVLAVSRAPGSHAEGSRAGSIEIETDNPRQAIVRVGILLPASGGSDAKKAAD